MRAVFAAVVFAAASAINAGSTASPTAAPVVVGACSASPVSPSGAVSVAVAGDVVSELSGSSSPEQASGRSASASHSTSASPPVRIA